jgi:hypothetical protein
MSNPLVHYLIYPTNVPSRHSGIGECLSLSALFWNRRMFLFHPRIVNSYEFHDSESLLEFLVPIDLVNSLYSESIIFFWVLLWSDLIWSTFVLASSATWNSWVVGEMFLFWDNYIPLSEETFQSDKAFIFIARTPKSVHLIYLVSACSNMVWGTANL